MGNVRLEGMSPCEMHVVDRVISGKVEGRQAKTGWMLVDVYGSLSLDGCQGRSGKAGGTEREEKRCSVRVMGRERLHPTVLRSYFQLWVILGHMGRGYGQVGAASGRETLER